MSEILFPHDSMRPIQEEVISLITKELDNKNHMILHAPTGLGKCVSKDTLILTKDGLEKIEDVYLKAITINSLNTNLKIELQYGQVIKKKKSQLFRLTTRTGRKIEITDDHKFFIIKNGKTAWKPLKQLKINDYIAIPSKLNISEQKAFFTLDMFENINKDFSKNILINTVPALEIELQRYKALHSLTNQELAKKIGITPHKLEHLLRRKLFKLSEAFKISSLNNKESITFKINKIGVSGNKKVFSPKLNEEFAYFLGLIIGDGFIDSGNRKNINISNKDKEIVNSFKRIAKKYGSKVQKKSGSDIDFYLTNKALVALFFSLGFPCKDKTKNVSIPNIFFKEKKLLKNVLSGIYDTDGSVFDNSTIELITKSSKLKDSVMHALLCLDIHPIIKEKFIKKRKFYHVYTCDAENNSKFKKHIGFRVKYKQKRLESAILKKGNSNIDIIPEISTLIKKCKEALNIPYSREKNYRVLESYMYKQRNPTKKGLKNLLNYFSSKSNKNCKELDALKEISNSNIFWDEIVNIETTKIDVVYDASIPETKNFVGNGIILHNTAASLAPTLTKALAENKTVFFLTSKNTQHKIAIDTLQAIKQRFNIDIKATDLVGKKWMCIQPGIQLLSSNEFNEYCKALREDKKCAFYENVKQGESLTPQAKFALSDLRRLSPVSVEQIVRVGEDNSVCPYELGMLLAKEANVIVTDYYYLFHPKIREMFFKKNEKILEDSILIIDEGHNLPNRLKDLATQNLSTVILKRAASEAKKYGFVNMLTVFEKMYGILTSLLSRGEFEKHISKDVFVSQVSNITDYREFIEESYKISDKIREEQKMSNIGVVATFMDSWLGGDEGFTRIISKKSGYQEDIITLSYRCLDPSVVAREVIERSHSTILMSGTLTPTAMYAKLLGFPERSVSQEFPSPFPQENRLNMVVAKTSTKFTARSDKQYEEIGRVVTDIINVTPGNSAIFFPSYYIKDQVDRFLTKIEKTVFHEQQGMTKQDKDEMIEKFRSYKKTGAALLAVVSGSFGEGVDLPGDELRTVVVVGLPLSKPNLETKALIEYYDDKFKNGWNYGYVFPAFNKIIQNAGRCIRSSTDKGVIVFLDERYTWSQYFRCFPDDWRMKVSVSNYKDEIAAFFKQHNIVSFSPVDDSFDDDTNDPTSTQMTLG